MTNLSAVPNDTPAALEHGLGVKWEDPPKAWRRNRLMLPWPSWARILRRKPGQWARLHVWDDKPQAANGHARKQKHGEISECPPGAYEFTTRRINDLKGSVLYGRYIGEDDDS